MIKLEVLKISNSGKAVYCQATKLSCKEIKNVGRGNITVSESVEVGTVHNTDYLSCTTQTKIVDDKKVTWLLLEDKINHVSSVINHFLLENKVEDAYSILRGALIKNDENLHAILIESTGQYYEFCLNKYNLTYDLYYESIQYENKELNVQRTRLSFKEGSLQYPLLDRYKNKLSRYEEILSKDYEDIETYDLTNILQKEELVKVYKLTDQIGFGKYKSKSLREVTLYDSAYLIWCIKNLNHFAVGLMAYVSICAFAVENEPISLLINEYKLKIYSNQYEANRLYKQKVKENKIIYQNWVNEGLREAFNNDPSNLWNID